MFFLSGKYASTGVEIFTDHFRGVNVEKNGKQYSVQGTQIVDIPAQALKCSFKHLNILDSNLFADCLNQLTIKNRKKRLSIALPDGCCRVFIKRYRELPDSEERINEMISWDIANQIKINDISQLRCAWEYKGKVSEQEHLFIIAVSMEKVVEQYESLFRGQGVKIDRILPAGLARQNFYAPDLSEIDRVAFLGLFDESISIFIFDKGIPLLYKILRKGLIGKSYTSAMDDLDLLLQYCHTELPDTSLDRIVMASDKVPGDDVTEFLKDSFSAKYCHVAVEQDVMDFSTIEKFRGKIGPFSHFSAALGAAIRV